MLAGVRRSRNASEWEHGGAWRGGNASEWEHDRAGCWCDTGSGTRVSSRARLRASGCGFAGENASERRRACGQERCLDTKSGRELKAQAQERRYAHDVFAFYYLDNF